MKTLNDLLRDADPLAQDPELSLREARVIRRLVVDAVKPEGGARPFVHRPLTMVAVLTLMVAAGIETGRRLEPQPAILLPRPAALQIDREPRQLQFATPGGTRIIWTFDPEFTLKETMP